MSAADDMDALTRGLLGDSTADTGPGIEALCRASARKAVGEVLDVIFRAATYDPGLGQYQIKGIFSEGLLRRVVEDAIASCTESP